MRIFSELAFPKLCNLKIHQFRLSHCFSFTFIFNRKVKILLANNRSTLGAWCRHNCYKLRLNCEIRKKNSWQNFKIWCWSVVTVTGLLIKDRFGSNFVLFKQNCLIQSWPIRTLLIWLVAQSKLQLNEAPCCTAELLYFPFLIMWPYVSILLSV